MMVMPRENGLLLDDVHQHGKRYFSRSFSLRCMMLYVMITRSNIRMLLVLGPNVVETSMEAGRDLRCNKFAAFGG